MNKEDNKMFYKIIGNSIQENKDRIEKLEKQNANYKKAKKKLQQENKQLKEQLDKYERLIEYLKSLDFYESELDYDYEEKPVSNYYPADMVYHISKMSNTVEILERMK